MEANGREPSLSGETPDLYEAWVHFPVERAWGAMDWMQLCLGVFNRNDAIAAIKSFVEFRWPHECRWDGHQMIHQSKFQGYNLGFLWPYGVPKR